MEAPHLVRVLDADPDLACRLAPAQAVIARRVAVAEVKSVAAGPWMPPKPAAGSEAHFGFLVLDGLFARTVRLCGSEGIELFGPGAVLDPWNRRWESASLAFEEWWVALHPTDLAILDDGFHATVSRWPGVVAELMSRALSQSRALALHRAVGGHAGLARRVHLLLWLLADHWGRVRPEGVEIPFRLSQQLIGQLVGARRPSVSEAMRLLVQAGLLERRAGGLLLHGGPPQPDELPVAQAQALST